MAKPIVIAKKAGPNWTVHYIDNDTGDPHTIAVIGSATIDDAVNEAKTSLDDGHRGQYTITKIELDEQPID